MRRAAAGPASSSSSSSSSAAAAMASSLDRARTAAQQEVRIRVLEASLALEQHRREQLETKYTKLKRRYARLERVLQDAGVGETTTERRPQSPTSSSGSTASAGSPPPATAEAASATRSPVREDGGGVIDLTSPVGSRRTSLTTPDAASTRRTSLLSHAADDFIAESPISPVDSAAVQPMRRGATSGSATRRSTRSSPARPISASASDPIPPPPPPLSITAPRVSGTRRRQLDFQPSALSSRPRPRLGPNPSDERPSAARAAITSRAGHASTVSTNGEEDPRRRRFSPQEETKSDAEPERVPITNTNTTADSDEAASIALAQYLQRQENLAAMREYEERLRRREYEEEQEREAHRQHHHHDHRHDLGDVGAIPHAGRLHDAAVDPDNMTYEELLQLGERVGDVKKERWRQVAVQVLSRLPTHRWTTQSSDDVTCIICQYGFAIGDVALTLPCAHVFHEECVSGWVRENNSCPLCKLEIADV